VPRVEVEVVLIRCIEIGLLENERHAEHAFPKVYGGLAISTNQSDVVHPLTLHASHFLAPQIGLDLLFRFQPKTAYALRRAAALCRLEFAFEVPLEVDEILRQRHAVRLELVQLAHNHEIDLVTILGTPLVLQLGEQETEFRLHVFKGHGRSTDPIHSPQLELNHEPPRMAPVYSTLELL